MSRSDNRKTIDDLHDVVVKLRQSWNDRLDFPPTEIPERYLRNVTMIGLEFSLQISGFDFVVWGLISHDLRVDGGGNVDLSIGAKEDQLSVFVEDVHLVKDKEGTVDRVGGHVRLQIPNQGKGVRVCDSLYFSFVSGRFLFTDRLTLENRKLDQIEKLLPVGIRGKFPDNVVKAGSQMVDDLASEHPEPHRDRPISMVLHSIKNAVVVHIGHDWVLAGLKKKVDFGLKIADVLVGPF